jgi:hypothetical protein
MPKEEAEDAFLKPKETTQNNSKIKKASSKEKNKKDANKI